MFWFIIGIIVGAGGLLVFQRTRRPDVPSTWYGWVLGVLAAVLGLLAIEGFVGSFAELEAQAAWMTLLTLGLPAVLLGTLAWYLPRRTAPSDAIPGDDLIEDSPKTEHTAL